MPVTARLSQRFYERFGDDVANELVDWFNAVDATYQNQLREINDLNWARVESRFTASDARIDALLKASDQRINTLFEASDARIDALFNASDARMEARLAKSEARMLRWMFGFWTATVVPILGIELALHGVFKF